MTQTASFDGTFYDGQSAMAQAVKVTLTPHGLSIQSDSSTHEWYETDTERQKTSTSDIRLTNELFPDALLILKQEASAALEDILPKVFNYSSGRKKFVVLVGSLIAATALIGVGLFWGIPAASGPLARKTPIHIEAQIGENISAQLGIFIKSCENEEAETLVSNVLNKMADNSGIEFDITYKTANTPLPNAFAFPGGNVLATRGLIDAIGDDQEAFWAVMAHELGHVKERHSMQAVFRSMGLSMFLEVITGGTGVAQQVVLLGGQMNEMRHSRIQEEAADDIAYEIMQTEELNPEALARAFEKMLNSMGAAIEEEDDENSLAAWTSSHPNTSERIERARQLDTKTASAAALPLTSEEWASVRNMCDFTDEIEEDETSS